MTLFSVYSSGLSTQSRIDEGSTQCQVTPNISEQKYVHLMIGKMGITIKTAIVPVETDLRFSTMVIISSNNLDTGSITVTQEQSIGSS